MEQKFVLPVFIYGALGYLIFMDITFYDSESIISLSEDIQGWIFIICIFMCYHHAYRCACLKRVSVDESFLYVSDYRKREIRIPLSDVLLVRQTYPMRVPPELIMITLSSPSKFGKKIFFIPKNESHSIFDPHSLVDGLNKLISSHKT